MTDLMSNPSNLIQVNLNPERVGVNFGKHVVLHQYLEGIFIPTNDSSKTST